jgi:hypothetical protein
MTLDSIRLRPKTQRLIVGFAWATAWFGLVLGPVHAMARHATPEGAGDLESAPLTRLWSVPLSKALAPLLDWSDPYTVYVTYGRLWIPVYASILLCALFVRTTRAMPRRREAWAWRVLLVAYTLTTLSIVGDYFTPWMDQSFVFVGMPAALLELVGSTWLGIVLVRSGFRPRILPWVLALWLPIVLALTQVTSLGSTALPMAFAWAYAGSRLRAREEPAREPAAGAESGDSRGVARRHAAGSRVTQ